MRRIQAILFLLCTLTPLSLPAQEIASITPDTVPAGAQVTITGGPFPGDTRIILGNQTITPSQSTEQRLVFTVPLLDNGDYAVALITGGRLLSSRFTLRLVDPEPRIESVSPANIDECSTPAERRITVTGSSFTPAAQLLLDGAAIAVDRLEATEILFTAPPLRGGVHHLQVVNSTERKSLPFALFVNSIPEIKSVEQGNDDVTSYELTIHGKNFLFSSTLIVDGTPVNPSLSSDGDQLLLPSQQRQGDRIHYVDCTTLVYTRYPYSRQLKRVSLQVVNPGGRQSPVYHLSIP